MFIWLSMIVQFRSPFNLLPPMNGNAVKFTSFAPHACPEQFVSLFQNALLFSVKVVLRHPYKHNLVKANR